MKHLVNEIVIKICNNNCDMAKPDLVKLCIEEVNKLVPMLEEDIESLEHQLDELLKNYSPEKTKDERH